MKKQFLYVGALILSTALMAGITSCKKDSSPSELTVSTLVAGTIDLNGAVAPTNVPAKPTIVVTFSTDVDPLTATAANVTLVRDYDTAPITLTLTASGKTITIVPTENLASGALHKLTFGTGLKSTEAKTLATAVSRTFTTDGFFAPSGMVAYWNFDKDAKDLVGTNNPSAEIAMTYTAGRKTAAGNAATFNGTTSIIEIPNGDVLMNTANFTLSFWVKALSSDPVKGHFVMGLGAFYGFQFEIGGDYSSCKLAGHYASSTEPLGVGEDLWFPGDGKTKDNGGWQGWTFCKDLTGSGGVAGLLKDKWAQVICVYKASDKTATMFINGEKMKQFDFDLWPDGDKKRDVTGLKFAGTPPDVYNDLAFGFVQSRRGTMWANEPWGGYTMPGANHFKGQLDDVRIFNKAVSDAEVLLMYTSEKP